MSSENFELAADEAFLDSVFDRALFCVENGLPVDAEALLEGRTHLQSQIERTVRLAQEIAASKHRIVPVVPGYVVLHELGRGGMGAVYLARQKAVGERCVALKILPQVASLSARARQRFLTEAAAIGALRHPHIVAVHDVVHQDGLFAYAMEWVDGKSLADVLEHLKPRSHLATKPRKESSACGGFAQAKDESEPGAQATGSPRDSVRSADPSMTDVRSLLDDSEHDRTHSVARAPGSYTTFICQIAIAIARALGEVHRANLLHRDVKPSNILLRRDGTPLLSDFGLVRETDTTIVTQAGHFVGTAAYASPEQLRGEHDKVNARSDVYSLGVTLYHGLTLQLPFRGRTPTELLSQIEGGKCSPIRRVKPALPRDLETIVSKTMEADPSRRYASADDLADDLECLLNLQPIKAKPATLVTRAWKAARRNRASLFGAVIGSVIALALTAAAGLYFLAVPRWVKQHVDQARLTLLHPEQGNQIFTVLFWNQPPVETTAIARETLEIALRHYDAALRMNPFDKAIRQEREVVELALREGTEARRHEGTKGSPGGTPVNSSGRKPWEWAQQNTEAPEGRQMEPHTTHESAAPPGLADDGARLSQGLRPGLLIRPRRTAPRLTHDATPWPTSGAAPLLFQNDHRSAGLFSLLTGDAAGALDEWSQLDPLGVGDPFIEAALGVLHLANGEPPRAYPRLQHAVDAYPNVGFLTQYLADAAVQCGDLDRAARLIERGRSQPMQDKFCGFDRVTADLYAAQGRDDEAIALYKTHFLTNPVAQFNCARLFESRGRLEEAVQMYARVCARIPHGGRPGEAFMTAMEKWWDGLSDVERFAAVRKSLDGAGSGTESILVLLRSFVAGANLRLEGARALPGTSVPGERTLSSLSSARRADESNPPCPSSSALRAEIRKETTLPIPGTEVPGNDRPPAGRDVDRPHAGRDVAPPLPLGEGSIPWLTRDSVWTFGRFDPPEAETFPLAPSSLRRFVAFFATLSAPFPSPYLQRDAVSLTTLAERMEVQNVNRWNCLTKLPSIFKNWLTESWISPARTVKGAIAESCAEPWCAMHSAARPRPIRAPSASAGFRRRSASRSLALSALIGVAAINGNVQGQCPPIGFEGLGDLPGGANSSYSWRVSADGLTVVGESASGNGASEAFRWRSDTGMVGLGTLPGGPFYSSGFDTNADGSIVVGRSRGASNHPFGPNEAFRWTQASGIESLGDLPGGLLHAGAYAISINGEFVVGWAATAASDSELAYWNSLSGWTAVPPPPGLSINGGAFLDVANNAPPGSPPIMVGYYSPAHTERYAIRFVPGVGTQNLGDLPGGAIDAHAWGVSGDGNVIVGSGFAASGRTAMRWTSATGMTSLGDLPGGSTESVAYQIMQDASLIIGYGTSAIGQEAVLWDATLTMHRVADVLAANGVAVPCNWTLTRAFDITENCGVITLIGEGMNPNGDLEAWIASYRPSAPLVGFFGLGDLPGGANYSLATAVSADGTTVVGYSYSSMPSPPGLGEAFRWRTETGMVGLGDLPGANSTSIAYGVSADGSAVVGWSSSGNSNFAPRFEEAFRWTQASGMVGLGDLSGGFFNSSAYSLSDDGLSSVGFGHNGEFRASVWTSADGWSVIDTLSGYSVGSGGSRNGQWATGSHGGSTPEAFRWSSATGFEIIGELPGGAVNGAGYSASNAGAVAGVSLSANGTEAMLWTPTNGMVGLGDLPGGAFVSEAIGISADGTLIVGYGTTDLGEEAVLWDESLMLHRVSDVLADYGVNVPCDWLLQRAYDVTINCGVVTIVGFGSNSNGDTEAFLASYISETGPILCNDGNACTINDTCSVGTCSGTLINPAIDCDDNNACTADSCNSASGCQHADISASCNDNNPCTNDSCNPASGCANTNNTSACNDNNACTTSDVCSGGSCAGTPVNPAVFCNDNNVCTNDGCNPATGCTHANNTDPCDDDNSCTTDDVCTNGACVGTPPRPWGDIVPCSCPSATAGCGVVNLDDILKVLAEFSGMYTCPGNVSVADIHPCNGNEMINLDDILGVLAAFAGATQCPCIP